MKNKILLKSLAGLCALAAVACGGGPGPQGSVAVYLDESQPIEKRVEDALSRMTLEEKVAILHAQSKFSSAGVPRRARRQRRMGFPSGDDVQMGRFKGRPAHLRFDQV